MELTVIEGGGSGKGVNRKSRLAIVACNHAWVRSIMLQKIYHSLSQKAPNKTEKTKYNVLSAEAQTWASRALGLLAHHGAGPLEVPDSQDYSEYDYNILRNSALALTKYLVGYFTEKADMFREHSLPNEAWNFELNKADCKEQYDYLRKIDLAEKAKAKLGSLPE